MGMNKYDTHILPNLEVIEEMFRKGADIKEVAEKVNVGESTFRKYMSYGRSDTEEGERYRALAEAYARACVVPDAEVEAALVKSCRGFEYDEVTVEEKLTRDGVVVEVKKVVRKTVPPNATAIMFYLTNRLPDKWKHKQLDRPDDDSGETGVVLLPEIGGDG